jgi:hypothetical protein
MLEGPGFSRIDSFPNTLYKHTHHHSPRPVEAAERRTAPNNGWNGANGMAANHV